MVGSIEGRVAVQHVEDNQQSKNFTFKCHRDGNDIYAVNSITFHPVHGTFVTCGSDGAYNFWDKVTVVHCFDQAALPVMLIPCMRYAGLQTAAEGHAEIYAANHSQRFQQGWQHLRLFGALAFVP